MRASIDLEPQIPKKSDVEPKRHKYSIAEPDSLNNIEKAITSFYKTLPWIKEKVDTVLVEPIALDKKYWKDDDPILYKNLKFYEPKDEFFQIRTKYRDQTKMSSDHVIILKSEHEILNFRIGFIVNGKFYIQSFDMFEKEKNLLTKYTSSKINVYDLYDKPITEELKNIARNVISEYTNEKAYVDKLVKGMEYYSLNAYDFSYKTAILIASMRYDKIFFQQLKNGYYNSEKLEHIFNHELSIDYSTFFPSINPTEDNVSQIKTYIEEYAQSILIQSYKYYDIPERTYMRDNRIRPPAIKHTNIKTRCINYESVLDVNEEDLTFLENPNSNDKLFCFDVKKLYFEFKNKNYINPITGEKFPDSFITKVSTLYSFNKPLKTDTSELLDNVDLTEEFVDPINNQKRQTFLHLLRIVKSEMNKFPGSKEQCVACNEEISNAAVCTLDDYNGKQIKYCSQNCFDKCSIKRQ